ncbi:MAG: FAD-dependent thymidylate synthase [Lachnospiraceae bacterium]|nr:FAD-dependent thymidylate synthase [Lachnospiraceae bacterium]
MNKTYVGEGKVVLLAGGGKTYCDVAANFCRAEEDLAHLITDEDTKKIIRHLISSGHTSALEFDQFIFGIEGFARVTEVQLVRKRLASYNIKSGRVNKKGARQFDVVVPRSIEDFRAEVHLDPKQATVLCAVNPNEHGVDQTLTVDELVDRAFPNEYRIPMLSYPFNSNDILRITEKWYNTGVELGKPEEELRYIKPQATEFKAAIRMDAAALRNWFMIRMCNRAQTEIRDLATKIHDLCIEASPALFEDSGPSCKILGYCPETEQCKQCKGIIPTKKQVKALIAEHWNPITLT